MRLLEVVVAPDTAPDADERAAAFAPQIRKTAMRTKGSLPVVVALPLVPVPTAAVRVYGGQEGVYEYSGIEPERLRCSATKPCSKQRAT